jgi:membrane-bound metal-dependent hydrolase YbcI (DUF457 family)
MPVTPLHLGIPGLVSFRWPEKVDIFAAALGSVLVDLDFFAFLLFGTKIHGFLHSFVGATVLALVIVGVGHAFPWVVVKLKRWFGWGEERTSLKAMVLGAFLGSYSHVLLDSLIYWDMKPFYPFEDNPFLVEESVETVRNLVYSITTFTTALFLVLYAWNYWQLTVEQEKKD